MELIDRAKVERITFQEPSYSDPINVLTEVRDKVRALPTVEAIPIDWLLNHCPVAFASDKADYIRTVESFNRQLRALIKIWRTEQAERKEE